MNDLSVWFGILSDMPYVLGLVARCPAAWLAGGCGLVALAIRLFCRLGVDQ